MAQKRIGVVYSQHFAFFDVSQGTDGGKAAIFGYSVSAIGHTIMRTDGEDREQSVAQRIVFILQKAWQRHGIIPFKGKWSN